MKRAWMVAAVGLAAWAAQDCKKTDAAGCTRDTDCKGDRVCVSGACVAPGAAPAAPLSAGSGPSAVPGAAPATAAPAGPVPAASAEPTAESADEQGTSAAAVAPPAGVAAPAEDACSRSVRAFRVLAAKEDPEAAARLPPEEEDVQTCRAHAWPAAMLECTPRVASVAEFYASCAKLAFQGTVDLRPGRELPPGTEPTQDGDFVSYSTSDGGRCGMLYKSVEPVEAMFVVCGDEVLAGPLTTVDEIQGVVAELSDQSRSAHDLRESIVRNWPSGGGTRYRVYDSSGRLIREE